MTFRQSAGVLANRRVFAQFGAEDGVPDGLTVDAEGCLWCALYGGRPHRPLRARTASVLASYDLPCPVVTAPGFGGPDMTTLFVTTGWSPGVQSAADETGPGGARLRARNRHQGPGRASLHGLIRVPGTGTLSRTFIEHTGERR